MSERTDEQLMLDFQTGDADAVKILFERYKSPIFNFSLRILANRAEAEDVTSDVFLAIFGGKYRFHPEAKFSTWLYTVARNRCLSQWRRKKGLVSFCFRTQDGKTQSWEPEDPAASASKTLSREETGELIRQAIARLPLEQREAIVLREYQRLAYEEIGQVLDCSLEKVKILIFRAREQLRVNLKPFIQEGLQ